VNLKERSHLEDLDRWEGNTEIDLEDVDWFNLAKDRFK
jgi:hypothetical protein